MRSTALASVLALVACHRAPARHDEVVADPETLANAIGASPSAIVSDAATWETTTVRLTWVVDDQSTASTIRIQRELVVRVGSNLRRFGFGPTQAGCGLFPDRPTIVNPVPNGAEVTRLRCWLGGGDDLVVTRTTADALTVSAESSSDGYGAPPPVAIPVGTPIAVPADAVFEDRVVFVDHGKVVDTDTGP